MYFKTPIRIVFTKKNENLPKDDLIILSKVFFTLGIGAIV